MANNETQKGLLCPHCGQVSTLDSALKKQRCPECNTLLKLEKLNEDEIFTTSKKKMQPISDARELRKSEMNADADTNQKSTNTFTPIDHTVVCSDCSAHIRVKKDIGKYRCPNCSSLLVYVKDNLNAHYVGAEKAAEAAKKDKPQTDGKSGHSDTKRWATRGRCANCGQSAFGVFGKEKCAYCKAILLDKKEKKVVPIKPEKQKQDVRTAAKVAHNTKPKNNASQSDELLTSDSPFTLSRYTRVALWIYFIEVSFFVIITILASATAGSDIGMVFGLVLLLGGFGIFFERASGGNLYSGASIINSGDDSDGFISKIAEIAIIFSCAINPLLGAYIAIEILGF
jgi:DNA-directed RNA polymerase subunit RPC12/RpoP